MVVSAKSIYSLSSCYITLKYTSSAFFFFTSGLIPLSIPVALVTRYLSLCNGRWNPATHKITHITSQPRKIKANGEGLRGRTEGHSWHLIRSVLVLLLRHTQASLLASEPTSEPLPSLTAVNIGVPLSLTYPFTLAHIPSHTFTFLAAPQHERLFVNRIGRRMAEEAERAGKNETLR